MHYKFVFSNYQTLWFRISFPCLWIFPFFTSDLCLIHCLCSPILFRMQFLDISMYIVLVIIWRDYDWTNLHLCHSCSVCSLGIKNTRMSARWDFVPTFHSATRMPVWDRSYSNIQAILDHVFSILKFRWKIHDALPVSDVIQSIFLQPTNRTLICCNFG